jgi:hypothetical protein
MKSRIAFIAFVIGAVLSAAIPASAGVDYNSGACVEFADTLEPIAVIPVGCELWDCCPGCPGNFINWHIRVSGDALESVVFQFDNLSADAKRFLKIKGKARWEGNALRVGPGETVVSGFKYDPRAVPPVATPRLFATKRILSRLRDELAQHAIASRDGQMEVVVEQLMGKYVINESRVHYNVTKCAGPFGNTDHIALENNIGNDDAVVLFDAHPRSGTCIEDGLRRGKEIIFMGDLNPGACRTEAMIFSDDNAMALITPTWTDSLFDKEPVTLRKILIAPVAVWLVDDDPGTELLAHWGMNAANYYYNFHNVGIAFSPTYTDISTNTKAVQLLDGNCSRVNEIKASSFYRPDQLNVYYVNTLSMSVKGRECWGTEPNIIFIARTSDSETPAHEIGHAFSLNHPNDPPAPIPGFGTENIMWSGASGRTNFTIGQALRMNLNAKSMLNVNHVRLGFVRDCDDRTESDICPKLIVDSTPK